MIDDSGGFTAGDAAARHPYLLARVPFVPFELFCGGAFI
jgi:hypothetical protein